MVFKEYSIVAILMLAYSIVLGHSIIPHHHHHDDEKEMSQSLFHHDNDHHHHDHDDDDDGSLSHEFAKYLHSSGSGDIYQKSELKIDSNIPATVYLLAVFDFIIKAVESPPPIRPLVDDRIPIALCCLSSKGLRAPPLA